MNDAKPVVPLSPGEDELLAIPEGSPGAPAVFYIIRKGCTVSCLHPKGFLLGGAGPAALPKAPSAGGKGNPVVVLGMESRGWVLYVFLACIQSLLKGQGRA